MTVLRTEIACRSPGAPEAAMFVFFSNRLGCLPSLLISALITLVLLALMTDVV